VIVDYFDGGAGAMPPALDRVDTLESIDAVVARQPLNLNPPIPAAPRRRGRSPEPIGRLPSGPPRGCAADRL
jgi:hypothetical protein